MPKFEDRFVHFRWDDSLKGKKVFYADSLEGLENEVFSEKNCEMEIITDFYNKAYPFCIDGDGYKFVYYDPNYELKLAYEKGKKIQFKCFGEWTDIINIPVWSEDTEYRIKPENNYCVVVGFSSRLVSCLVAINKSSVVEGAHVFYESDSFEDCADWIADRRKFEDVMIAYSEGKEVEFLNVGDVWCQASTPVWRINAEYRIKPKGYRAFKNTDELKKKWEKLCPTNVHRPSLCEPLIWVRCKANNATSVIIRFAGTVVTVNFANYTLDELFKEFTFLDGTPCGIEE